MKIVGISFTTNPNGERLYTIYGVLPFEEYFKNAQAGRNCIGEMAVSVYIGRYDCSALKLGMEIEILYDKAISTKKGTFQAVKKIEVITGK